MRSLIATATLLLATSLLAAQPPKAETAYGDNTPTAAGRVLENVPNPKRVTIDVTLPGVPTPARVTVKEGVLARFDSETGGGAFAVAVRIVDETNHIVEARFFEVTKFGDGKERLSVPTTFNLQAGNAFRVPYSGKPDGEPQKGSRIESNATAIADDFFAFDLVGIDVQRISGKACSAGANRAGISPESSSVPYTPKPLLRCGGGDCCIGCGGWQVCACAVQFCGISCCCDECCIPLI